MENKPFEELQSLVIQWSKDRKIIPNSTPVAQWNKAQEEMEELLTALLTQDMGGQLDGIGDVLVCIINVAALSGLDVVECLEHAYGQIKNRRGYLREDGIFVKEKP